MLFGGQVTVAPVCFGVLQHMRHTPWWQLQVLLLGRNTLRCPYVPLCFLHCDLEYCIDLFRCVQVCRDFYCGDPDLLYSQPVSCCRRQVCAVSPSGRCSPSAGSTPSGRGRPGWVDPPGTPARGRGAPPHRRRGRLAPQPPRAVSPGPRRHAAPM